MAGVVGWWAGGIASRVWWLAGGRRAMDLWSKECSLVNVRT